MVVILWRAILGGLLLGARLGAQPPAIFQDGIANAASRISTVLPFGSVAPGSRIRISGVRFGDHPVLTLNTHGVTLQLKSVRTEDRAAEFLLPRDLPIGESELKVAAEGGDSKTLALQIVATAFGIQALHRVDRVVTLEGTGLGADGTPRGLEVVLGGIPTAPMTTRAGAGGVDQIQFRLPDVLPSGCHLTVYVRTPSHISNFVDLPDLPGCVDDTWPVLSPRPNGAGSVALVRSTLTASSRTWTADSAFATFLTTGKRPLQAPLWFPLTAGQCRLQASTELVQRDPFRLIRINAVVHSAISAGDVIYYDNRSIGESAGSYQATLGGTSPAHFHSRPLFYTAGKTVKVTAEDGKTGPFSVKVPFIDDLNFSHRSNQIDRSQPLTVRWQTTQPQVAIVLYSETSSSVVQGVCAANGSVGEFTVPPDILRSLPVTDEGVGVLTGYVAVAALSEHIPFTAKGLKLGIASSVRFRVQQAHFY